MTTTEEKVSLERSAFGTPMTPLAENPLFADPTPEEIAAAPEAPAEEAQETSVELKETAAAPQETSVSPEVPAEETTEVTTSTPVEETTEVTTETPAEEAATVEELIFGKYKDLDAAKQGYDNLRDLQRRTAERSRGLENDNGFLVERARELETTLQQAIPYIKSLESRVAGEVDANGYPAPAPAAAPVMTPEQVDLIVRQRVDQERAAATERDSNAAAEAVVHAFYDQHQVAVGDETDAAMFESVRALNDAWAATDVNIGDPETLAIVLETTKSPELLTVLKSHPEYIDNDAGMQLARFEAAILRGETPITQQTRTVPASQVGQRADLPVTESASTGGSPPPAAPTDEWSLAKRANAESRGKAIDSPFFE